MCEFVRERKLKNQRREHVSTHQFQEKLEKVGIESISRGIRIKHYETTLKCIE
jgi:hypothetical protein